jgi:ABC-type branched-subunit amino acid transport system ATPase component
MAADPVLAIAGARVSFGGVHAVDGVDLSVREGEVVGIIGPNGAGKTTLLDAVSGFVALDAGTIRIAGRDATRALPYARARMGVARSFQDARMFPNMSVRETLMGGMHQWFAAGLISHGAGLSGARDDERIAGAALDDLLDLVDVRRFLDHRIADLSIGTVRAVELAWIATRRPRLVLLDEPASGLQQSEVDVLGALVHRIRRDAAAVVIDHDVPFVAGIADRMIAMDLGRVIADGDPDTVLSHPDVVESYLGAPAGRSR